MSEPQQQHVLPQGVRSPVLSSSLAAEAAAFIPPALSLDGVPMSAVAAAAVATGNAPRPASDAEAADAEARALAMHSPGLHPATAVTTNGMPTAPTPAGKLRWTVGRAPWYDATGQRTRPFFIGVTGGSASGKTSVCKAIVDHLSIPWVGLLSMDRYYRSLTPEEQALAHRGDYNFDHPNAFDIDALVQTIQEMQTGRVVHVPIYDFATHGRLPETDKMYGVDVVIVEGILLLYDKRVRDMMDLKVYVDTDSDLRLARRITRDIRERGRTVEGVLEQYQRTVKASFEEYILPTKRYADIIVPWNDTNKVAIDLLTQHIVSRLEKKQKDAGAGAFPLAAAPGAGSKSGRRSEMLLPSQLPSTVHVMPQTNALRALHTLIRDRSAAGGPDEFNFNLKRLATLLTQHAMTLLPYTPTTVTTPTGAPFHGLATSTATGAGGAGVCCVSIVRTGELFEGAVREVLPEASVGKIVVQQAAANKQELGPRLYYAKLPETIAGVAATGVAGTVLLFDGVLATGGAVMMAVQVLLDHGVREDHIVFVCIVAAPEGLHRVTSAFPRLRVVASWVDDGLDAQQFVAPGVGYLGDRYFGTGPDAGAAAGAPASASFREQ